jgi:hypothetical protein
MPTKIISASNKNYYCPVWNKMDTGISYPKTKPMKTNTLNSSIQSEGLSTTFTNRVSPLINFLVLILMVTATHAITAQSQDKTVKGVVSQAEDGEKLAGVHIQLKGTSFGTITDAGGKFTFPQQLKVQDVLVFSFVGLKTQEFTITETTPEFIDIQLVYEDFTMVGELSDDGVYTARKRPLSRLFSGLKRNR